jgi:outer membrane immunogenic protein
MKRFLFAGVAIAALAAAQTASAADLPRRGAAAPPAPAYVSAAPIFSWAGVYAGLNAGYGFGSFRGAPSNLFGKANGALVGGTLGYNYQAGQVVFGVEGDYGFDGAKNTNLLPGRGIGVGTASATGKISDMLTARGRIGYSVERALLFATGGYAGATIKGTVVDPTLGATYSSSSWRNGYALGAGIEYAFTQNVSAKAEYLYTDFGKKSVFTAPWATNVGAHQSLVRGGVNYHF